MEAFRNDEYLWWQVAEYSLRLLHDPHPDAILTKSIPGPALPAPELVWGAANGLPCPSRGGNT